MPIKTMRRFAAHGGSIRLVQRDTTPNPYVVILNLVGDQAAFQGYNNFPAAIGAYYSLVGKMQEPTRQAV